MRHILLAILIASTLTGCTERKVHPLRCISIVGMHKKGIIFWDYAYDENGLNYIVMEIAPNGGGRTRSKVVYKSGVPADGVYECVVLCDDGEWESAIDSRAMYHAEGKQTSVRRIDFGVETFEKYLNSDVEKYPRSMDGLAKYLKDGGGDVTERATQGQEGPG